MSRALVAAGPLSLAAAATVFAGLVASPGIGHASGDCSPGWEFGPTLKLLQSDGWSVTVSASGREIGGPAVALPPDRSPLWRGTGEGGTDGTTVNFAINWDNGRQTQYTGTVDQGTGSVKGERPDGTTWHTTANLRCIGASDTAPAPDTPPPSDTAPAPDTAPPSDTAPAPDTPTG